MVHSVPRFLSWAITFGIQKKDYRIPLIGRPFYIILHCIRSRGRNSFLGNHISLQDRARQLLDCNAKSGDGYYYVSPSNRKYPHQWSWDSSFHAIVNCRLGRVDLARDEILTLLSEVTADGHLPHVIFRGRDWATRATILFRRYWPVPGRSPLIQPPVVALAVRDIWQNSGDEGFLKEALPLLERHFAWLATRRCYGNSALVSIISPWESGVDHKPAFDRPMGRFTGFPLGLYCALYYSEMRLARINFDIGKIQKKGLFNVREVLFNTIYALGLEALGAMYAAIGDKAKAEHYRKYGIDVENAILSECYDPVSGLYFDIDVRNGKLLMEPSVTCLMPIALSSIDEDRCRLLIDHLRNPDEFWLNYPIPSVPANNRYFVAEDQRYLWRGPTWINTNWFIVEGLRRHGYAELAESIAEKSRGLVEKSGFREYYNPLDGEGEGAADFGWSTLAAVM